MLSPICLWLLGTRFGEDGFKVFAGELHEVLILDILKME
jgi:hypothetical protein